MALTIFEKIIGDKRGIDLEFRFNDNERVIAEQVAQQKREIAKHWGLNHLEYEVGTPIAKVILPRERERRTTISTNDNVEPLKIRRHDK